MDVNVRFTDANYTPLIIAIIANDLETVKFLIDNGADSSQPGYAAVTPLMWAAQFSPSIFKLLIEQHASCLDKDYKGHTIIDYAHQAKNADVEAFLKENKENLRHNS